MQSHKTLQARHLRKRLTHAEQKLWQELRGCQLGGFRFRRQVPLGLYIADFVCFEPRIVIEVDGSQHMNAITYDEQRTSWLQSRGYVVLRFWNTDVLCNLVAVKEEILNRCLSPHPILPPAWEGTRS